MKSIYIFLIAIFLFISCKPDFKPATVNTGFANLNYCLYIGGDFMSGYTDGALSSSGQHNSIPFLFNQQLIKVGINTYYLQHFVSLPDGYGFNFPFTKPKFVTSFHLGNYTDCLGITSLFPLKDSIASNNPTLHSELTFNQQNTQYSVEAVPYAKITEYNSNSIAVEFGINPYYPSIASNQGYSTILSDAFQQQYTFYILWAGMEDVYQYAQRGGQIDSITDFAAFDAAFDNLLDSLNQKGGKGVVANIPDISVFPFYTYIPWNGLELTKTQADSLNILPFTKKFSAGPNGFIIFDSSIIGNKYRQMNEGEYVLLSVPSDSIKCDRYGSTLSLPPYYILTSTQVANINIAIQHINAKIATSALNNKIPMVDMNAYFNNLKNGFYYDGIKFSSAYITGNFISLDGYHPTGQGYGLLTNEFIKTINGFYNSKIPLVDITKLPGVIFP